MWLLILLVIPTIVLLVSAATSCGKFTLKEFMLAEVLMIFLVFVGYSIAKYQSISDVEIWNGWLTKAEFYEEWWERVSCRHEIPCSHKDKNGNTLHSNDGHYHLYDVDYHPPYWEGLNSNSESLALSESYYREKVRAFGNESYENIFRFSLHRGNGNKYVTNYVAGTSEFTPTATPHSFQNYIKASPFSVLRKMGQGNKFDALIPPYPRVDTSRWESNRFITLGLQIPGVVELNKKLSEINARLGRSKQVNIIFLAVNTPDSSYIHSLEEKWLGGKKNDFIIILGCTAYPKIDWVRIMSWSLAEDLKVELRDKILSLGTFERSGEILAETESAISKKFVRRRWADFEYLMAGYQPSAGVMIFLIIFGCAISFGLSYYCRENDIFGEERRCWR